MSHEFLLKQGNTIGQILEKKTSRSLELVFKAKFLASKKLELRKIDYMQNNDLQTEIAQKTVSSKKKCGPRRKMDAKNQINCLCV